VKSTSSQRLENANRKQNAKTVACIRCGVCLRVCSHNLSPVLIKEAFEKGKKEKLRELKANCVMAVEIAVTFARQESISEAQC